MRFMQASIGRVFRTWPDRSVPTAVSKAEFFEMCPSGASRGHVRFQRDSDHRRTTHLKTGASRARPANVSLQRLLSEPKVVLTVTKRVLGFGVACGVCTLGRT